MNVRLKAISFLVCWCATAALGQSWVVYAPPEKDFSVLFPAPPAQTAEAEGAVAFSATAENITFVVYRRDPRLQPIGSPVMDIQQRLRGDNDDIRVRRLDNEEADASGEEHIFMTRGNYSIHRLFIAEGRYYEVVVRSPTEGSVTVRRVARDFFGSFRMAGVGTGADAAAGVAPEVRCKDRSNAFSRAFCEYSTCLRSQYRTQPYCQQLLRFR